MRRNAKLSMRGSHWFVLTSPRRTRNAKKEETKEKQQADQQQKVKFPSIFLLSCWAVFIVCGYRLSVLPSVHYSLIHPTVLSHQTAIFGGRKGFGLSPIGIS